MRRQRGPDPRCTSDQFYQEQRTEKQGYLDKLGFTREDAPESYASAELRWDDRDWRAWRYNEAIGWLRLYTLSTQVRGEYWFVNAKQIRKDLRQKRFVERGKAFELGLERDETSAEIYQKVHAQIEALQSEPPFNKRYLDTEAFHGVGPYIDWRGLLSFD